MYNMDYEIAKNAFLGKGKIDHVTEGTYEVVGKINLSIDNLQERFEKCKNNVAVFSFWGDIENDPLKKIEEVVEMQQKIQEEQECTIVTVAPVKEWVDNQQLLRNFKQINIKRFSVDDKLNNEKLGCETLTKAMYKQIDEEVKEKINLVVYCDKANIEEVETLVEFFEFAKEVGIKNIMFLAEKEIKQHKNNPDIEAENARMKEAIERLRRGEPLVPTMVEPIPVKDNAPLFQTMRDELIQAGWNLDILKVSSQDKVFFFKTTLIADGMTIVLKQGIEESELKANMWQSARSRKYIVKI